MGHIYYAATILVLLGMDINDYPGTSAIWVSLEGCYISLRQNSSRNMMPHNGPRHCFDACPYSNYIGLQDSWCMCDTVGENYALPRYCNSRCSGETDMLCGSVQGIAVYSKVNPMQTISVSGDFGCVYVQVSVPSSGIGHAFKLYATNNCSEEHCGAYVEALISGKCVYERTLVTWFKARDKFSTVGGSKFLLPEQYVRDDRCPPQTDQGININSGEFWIGLIWITTDATTTSMNTMAMTSTHVRKTSSTPATTTTTPILTELQSTKISAASLSTIDSTTTVSSPPVNLIAVYIAVPVGVCFVSVVVVIICWCQKLCCFRSCRKGAQTSEIENNTPPETPYLDHLIDVNVPPSASSGSNRATFQGHQENIIPTVSGQKDHYAESNAGHYDIYMDIKNPIHLEGRNVKSEYPFEMDDRINSSMSKRDKGKGKQRREKNKEDHTVRASNENVEIPDNTDNHTGLDRYTNGGYIVQNKITENPNDQSRYDEENRTEKETNQRGINRDVTISDVYTTVSTVQDQESDIINGSDEVHNELNNNKNEIPIEETRKRKRSRKRKKINRSTLFDVPAEHPVVEMQTDIDKLGSRIKQNEH